MARYAARTRKACLPCRERKRKCNGASPCDSCTQSELRCTYHPLPPGTSSSTRVSRSNILTPVERAHKPKESVSIPTVSDTADTPASLLVNSGSGFLRQLVGKMDTTNSPYLRATAWNIGSRFPKDSTPPIVTSQVTDLLSHDQIVELAQVYFTKIHPCYGFIERDHFFRQVDSRWAPSLPGQSQVQGSMYDAILCGVAALGSYFSSKSQLCSVEQLLVALAKSLLTSASAQESLTKDVLQGWVLRIVYLRLAAEPLDAWFACCSAMHLFEAVALDLGSAAFNPWLQRDLSSKHLPQPLHCTFVVAQHQNVWISYELGSLLVQFPMLEVLPEFVSEGSYTNELQKLLPASLSLFKPQEDHSLRQVIKDIVIKTDTPGPLIMAQCNLILCILRRLWSSGSLRHDDDELIVSALGFLGKGLAAARQMIQEDCPWHHMANVPFQTICISLALDTPAALQIMRDAVQTLMSVRQAYPTVTLTEAYDTTCMLLYLHQKQHAEKVQVVGDVLDNLLRPPESSTVVSPYDAAYTNTFPHGDAELARITALMPAFPILQDMDVDDLLAQYTEYTQGLQ